MLNDDELKRNNVLLERPEDRLQRITAESTEAGLIKRAMEPRADPAPTTPPAAQHHYAIRLLRLDLAGGPVVETALPIGARIVHSFVMLDTAGIVLARPGEQPGARLVPMLVVLVDPRQQATERRRFLAMVPGEGLASDQELQLVGTFTAPDGSAVVVLFEERIGAPA